MNYKNIQTPKLFIIAGPNGAGKSTFANSYIPIPAFDADEEMEILIKQHSGFNKDVLVNRVRDHIFPMAKHKAIQDRANFAYQTNFSSDDPLLTTRQFRAEGYRIHLLYFGLPNLDESVQLVNARVRVGGHHVPPHIISENYIRGFQNLCQYYTAFDHITIIGNAVAPTADVESLPEILLTWSPGRLHIRAKRVPSWIEKFVEHLSKN